MNKKICFLLFLALSFCVSPVFPQAKNEIKKIVIDAGHGGTDPGALGAKSKEKDITLALALEIGKRIKEKCPDVEVLYTRTTDVYPTVKGRAIFANNKHADLFISIHCNAAENKSARGVETWVMGLGVSDHSFEVARRENASILLEDDYKSNYGDFDPNSPESYIMFALYQSAAPPNSPPRCSVTWCQSPPSPTERCSRAPSGCSTPLPCPASSSSSASSPTLPKKPS